MNKRLKEILIGIGIGFVLGLTQWSGVLPGITDVQVQDENFIKFLGGGAALGFIIGLANLSRANPNPHREAAFACFLTMGVVALAVNLYKGYIGSNFGINFISVVCIGYIPAMCLGGLASIVFSKNA